MPVSAFLSFCFLVFSFMPPVFYLSPSLSRFHSGAYATPERNPGWPASFARPFVKGDKPNRAAYSREKTTMKTDKNSRTQSTSGTDTQTEQAVPNRKHTQAAFPKRVRISYENWLVKYHPIQNHLDTNAPFDGCMFETFGKEVEFVRAQPTAKIWTLLECDGKTFICEGFHFVNRIGYFITEVSYPSNRLFCIKAD